MNLFKNIKIGYKLLFLVIILLLLGFAVGSSGLFFISQINKEFGTYSDVSSPLVQSSLNLQSIVQAERIQLLKLVSTHDDQLILEIEKKIEELNNKFLNEMEKVKKISSKEEQFANLKSIQNGYKNFHESNNTAIEYYKKGLEKLRC